MAARLSQLGYKVGGFSRLRQLSTVFKGSGLSSSAAFEVLLVAIFDALYNGWVVDPKLQRPDFPVRRKRLLRQALRPDGSDGQLPWAGW